MTFRLLSPVTKLLKQIALVMLFIVLNYLPAACQLYDNTWVLGNRAAMVHFDNNQGVADTVSKIAYTDHTWASICNKEGKLQFFTNGFVVYNGNGDTIPGAIKLCDSLFMESTGTGSSKFNGALILPRDANRYYIFTYCPSDQQMADPYASDRLYYAELYVDQDGESMWLTSKKNVLYNQKISDSHLTACRHANGRDWWLIANKYQSNEYLKYLVTPQGIIGPFIQAMGTAYGEPEFYGQLAFSPDGSKFAGVSGASQLNVFDFDRCTGVFSNPLSIDITADTIILPNGLPQIWGGGGMTVSFSPNSRYLYLGYMKVFWQYDTQAPDIVDSRKTIWKWKVGDSNTFTFESFLTPTGKILIGNYHGVNDPGYNMILFPNIEDTACNFQDSVLYVRTANHNYINNTFNYRLGALTGSTCDTIVNDIENVNGEQAYIKISPNPATDKIELSLYKYLPNAQLLIADESGKIVHENKHYYLDEYLNISQWQAGVYFVKIYNTEKSLTTRFVKE